MREQEYCLLTPRLHCCILRLFWRLISPTVCCVTPKQWAVPLLLLVLRVHTAVRTHIPFIPLGARPVSGRVEDRSALDGVEIQNESL
jgi:hypothetical protein